MAKLYSLSVWLINSGPVELLLLEASDKDDALSRARNVLIRLRVTCQVELLNFDDSNLECRLATEEERRCFESANIKWQDAHLASVILDGLIDESA